MSAARKGGLGRGLDALIPSTPILEEVSGVIVAQQGEVDINSILPNPKQPREVFDQDLLNELAASIKEVGVLQPPVVRDIGGGKYELIMGERRLRASKLAGLKTIPVIVRATKDNELLREALLENIHRSQLNPLEEGAAYQNLLNDFGYTHDELATKVGKSRPAISNALRLLNLPTSVQQKVAAGTISAGHARALLGLSDQNAIEKLANRIVAEGLSVRTVEEIIAISKPGGKSKKNGSGSKKSSPELKELADQVGDILDTRVRIESSGGKGEIIVEYSGAEDLQRLVKLISSARR
mgnify:CR=1 FL=1